MFDINTSLRSQRRWGAALSAAYAVIIIYGSLVPFEPLALPAREAWSGFWKVGLVPFAAASKTDFLVNLLLDLPLGAFLAAALMRDRARPLSRLTTILITCVAAAALGVVVEFLQAFFPPRVPSLNDVVAQTFGALLGLVLWQTAGPSLTSVVDQLRLDQPRATGFVLALAVYTAIYAVVAWSPFDFSLRPAEVWEKYREGRVSLDLLPAGASGIVDMFRTLMVAAPFGWLASAAAARWRPLPSRAVPLAIVVVIVGVAELGQVIVLSRHAAVGDLWIAAAGACLGALAVPWPTAADGQARQAQETRLDTRLGAAVLGAAVVIGWSWRPFNFVLSSELARDRLPNLFQLPLRGYFAADPLNALADASAKVALALALGALLDATMPATVSRTARTIAAAVALLGVYALAEIGQLLLPGRYPDSTDILLGVMAGSIGCAVHAVLRK